MDVAEWLRGLGLTRYEQSFRGNDIDAAILPELTADDLVALGVTSVGHRRKLLAAIASLRNRPHGEDAAKPPVLASVVSLPLGAGAERRQLTVMFCDLVGSTALAARLDPEDLREVIGAYHRFVAEVVGRFDGFVAKYMGDGVLIYFGYPQAHEDDAERAVRTGLALVGTVKPGPEAGLQVRVGIATGVVVVGDLIGSGEAQERGVVGETPNLAARLQGIAPVNGVLIAEDTWRLVGDLFDYRDLGAVEVRGLEVPTRVWQVLRPRAVESRFEALRAASLTPLIGRNEEIELLLRRWARAKAGEGQVVLLSGEPGIGKSRLTAALRDRLEAEPHTRLRYFGSPYHQDTPLYPTITQLERAAGFRREDTTEQRLDKLEAVLAQATNDVSEAVPLLAALMSIPTGDRYPPLDLSPQMRKEKTLQALVTQVEGLAARQPVLIVSEDVHWADPSSLEVLDLIVDRVRTLPVLLIITFRPEFTPPWVGRPKVTLLSLRRLPSRQCAEMIARVTGGKVLPKEIADQIIERTDGIPLFIEELTKAVLESGVLSDAGDRYALTGPSPSLTIPVTLHASLLARLDRLAPVRPVAQIGAALGRKFSHELIGAVAAMPRQQLDDALEQLVGAELIYRRGSPPHAEYSFKHALVQDAAYGTMLRTQRHVLHGRIAAALEEQFPDIAEQQPELLAHHHTEARSIERAVWYWGRAGRQSMARSAMTEAVRQLQKGLELLAKLPEGSRRRQQELELQCALSGAFVASKGQGAPETGEAYIRARALCEQLGDSAALVPVLSGLCTFHLGRSEYEAARGIAGDLLRVAEERGDTASRLVGHRSMGACLHQLGQFGAAVDHLERVLALYVPKVHHSIASVAAQDMRTAALSYLSLDRLILGYPDHALARVEEAVSWAREIRHPHLLVFALTAASYHHLLRRAGAPALAVVGELVSLSREQNFPFWLALGNLMRGYLLVMRGELAEGEALSRQSFADLRRMGSSWNETYHLSLLAGCCARSGQIREALELLGSAMAIAENTGERWFEAELRRLSGECLTANPEGEQAAAAPLQGAIAVAQEQNAKLWELRAATNLARLWRKQGKRTEARTLLTPVYAWFTQGFDAPDLKDAKALLGKL